MTTEPTEPTEPPSIAHSDAASANSAFARPALVLALMSVTAGFADGYMLARYDVFVANQSGNLVRLGMALVDSFGPWAVAFGSVAGFFVGSGLSWALRRASGAEPRRTARLRLGSVLVLSVAAGALAGAGASPLAVTLVASTAMGVLATVLTHIGSVPTQPGFQSANVLATAEGMLDWATHADPVGRRGRQLAWIATMTVLFYVAGGALGALAEKGAGLAAFLGLAPLAACLLLVARPRR